jgi:hypothetical protein
MQRVLDEVVRHVASSSLSSSSTAAAAAAQSSVAIQPISTSTAHPKVIGGGGLAAVRSRKPLAAVQAPSPLPSQSQSNKKGKTSNDDFKKPGEGASLARERVKTPETVAALAVGAGQQVNGR